MAVFSDSFSGSGPLGQTEVGGAQWVNFDWWSNPVTWTRQGGVATPSDLQAGPIVAINVGTGDADVQVNVHPAGGDCLYFRIKDRDNWWRMCVVQGTKQGVAEWETAAGTAEYLWQQAYRHSDPTSGAYPLITYEYMWSASNGSPPPFEPSIWLAHAHDTDGDGDDDINHSGYYYVYGSPAVVDGKVGAVVDNTWSVYYVRLEKSVDGEVEEVDFWVQGANHLRVILQRSLINVYINNTFKGQYTDSTHERATFHGMGYQWYSGYSNSALDNFIVDTFFTNPTAPTIIGPKGSAVINRDIPQQFTWRFNDPDPGDLQAKYELRYRLSGAGTWQNTVTGTTPNWYHVFPSGTFTEGATYEWQVRCTDQTGRVGPYSPSAYFTAEVQPVGPTITSPTNGGTVLQSHVVQWSHNDQDSYQLQILDASGAVVIDTGEVVSTTARSHSVTFPETDVSVDVQVRVKTDGLWSEYGKVNVTTQFIRPTTPYFNLLTSRETASLLVEITNPPNTLGEPATTHNEIWVDDGQGFTRRVSVWPLNTNWVYWTPVGGRDYISSVRVVAVGTNGARASANPPKFVVVSPAVYSDLGQALDKFIGKGAVVGLVTAAAEKVWGLGKPVNRAVSSGEAMAIGLAKAKDRPVNQITQTNTALTITPELGSGW